MSDETEKKCPKCGAEVEPSEAWTHGHRTSDGWDCTECDWTILYGEEPWEVDV